TIYLLSILIIVMKEDYKKFFKRLIVLIILIVLLDRAVGSLMQYLFYQKATSNFSVSTHAIEGATEDILIYGSSRATHHYDPQIFKDTFGLSCFNCGKDGMDVLY